MFYENDRAYLERRRVECLERADLATDLDIARLYRSFAIHYTRAMDELDRYDRADALR